MPEQWYFDADDGVVWLAERTSRVGVVVGAVPSPVRLSAAAVREMSEWLDAWLREHGVNDALPPPDANAVGGVRRSDPSTSRMAALHNYPRSGSQRARLLDAIAGAGETGLTAEEASDRTAIPYRSATPRIGELKHGQWITTRGDTRRTTSGAESDVLVLTERARAEIRTRGGRRTTSLESQ